MVDGTASRRLRDTIDRRMNVVQKRLVQTLCILLAGSAIVSFGAVTSYNSSYAAMEYLRFLGICFGTLAAAGAAGAFLGFLFGVPRLLQRVNGGDGPKPKEAGFNNLGAGKTTRTVAGNSNLEEISDWLTKIIVGLALVNAYEILGLGRRIVSFLARFGDVDANLAKAYFACLIIAGFVACFLAIYLEARTRLTFILADIEQLLDGALDEDAIAAANEAPILISSGMTDLSRTPAPASDADRTVAQVPFAELSTAEEFAAWGSAQARLANFQAAARAMTEAATRGSDDIKYLLRLADIRRLQGNLSLEIDALDEATSKRPQDVDIFRRLILLLLYRSPPQGFTRAITLCEQAFASPLFAQDPFLRLYYAAAQGQKATWLRDNPTTEGNYAKDASEARAKALEATRSVIELTGREGPAYTYLKAMLYPKELKSSDDDLAVFNTDPEFTALVPLDLPAEAT